MATSPSPFIWYELMTDDTAAAEAFYRSVVGWQAKDAGMPGLAYTLLSVGDVQVGGMMALPPEALAAGARPGWIGYLAVDDADASAARIRAAGGAVHRAPEDIPGIGRFAVVTDPHGAAFIVMRPFSDAQPLQPAPGTPGHVGWHELHAGDLDSAWAFYAAQFGWTRDQAIDMGPAGTYQLFATGGPAVGGMMTKTPDMPAPMWLYYFNVDGVDAAVARVTQGGGQLLFGPEQVPGGSWIVQCTDPQGAMFALVGMRR
jgi:predicted enzyme related to lactoylglutathione lyase